MQERAKKINKITPVELSPQVSILVGGVMESLDVDSWKQPRAKRDFAIYFSILAIAACRNLDGRWENTTLSDVILSLKQNPKDVHENPTEHLIKALRRSFLQRSELQALPIAQLRQ